MGLDPLSAIAPARVKILIVPLGNVRQSRFASFVTRLRTENVVRLGDVSPDGRPHRTMFSPLAFPTGSVIYDISTSLPPASHLALAPFELYREPLIVVAIADGLNWIGQTETEQFHGNKVESLLLEGLEKLRDDFPKALVHQVLVFDFDTTKEVLPAGVIAVPSLGKSKITTMKTIVCDLTSDLLAEMTTYAKSLQALPTILSPNKAQGVTISNGYTTQSTEQNDSTSGSSRPSSANGPKQSFSPANELINPLNRSSIPRHMLLEPRKQASTSDSRSVSPHEGTRTPPTTFDEIAGVHMSFPSSYNSPHDEKRPESQDRASMQGFGAGSIGERERNKGRGRVGCIIGAIYLLAGRWPDAIRELTESALIAKANSDHLWHAKALDQILVCLLMYAWAGMDFQIPYVLYPGAEKSSSGTNKSSNYTNSNVMLDKDTGSLKTSNRSASLQSLTTLLPDLVRHILNLYVRAWTFTEDKVPQLSYSDSTIRFAKLLTIINLSSGILDDDGLRRIVLNVKISRSPVAPPQLSSFLTKGELTNLLFRAFPPNSSSTDAVSIIDRTTILSGIASVLSELGYQRKKALVLRELLTGLSPALVQARKDGAAEMGFHPAASLASLDLTPKATSEQHAEINQNVLENGIQNFLALVCQIYEIPAFGPGNIHISSIETQGCYSPSAAADYDTQESIVSRTLEQTTMKVRGNQILKLDILRSCIDICEALPDLGGVLRFSAHMLRTAGSCIIPGPEIDVESPALSMEEQIRLASNISRTVSTARQLGILNVEAEYWDEFLVRSVEIVDMNPSRNPTSHPKGELQVVNAIDKKEVNNPFIYDPFRRSAASNLPETLLVAQEEAMFRVTLQNLYDFDVDIERIKIDSIDLPFVCSYQSGMIGPYRTQAFFLTGTPRDSGSLRVVGCRVKVKGCRERSFPIFNTPWTPTSEIKIGRPDFPSIHNDQKRPLSNASDASRGKRLGAFPGPISSSIALNVIKAQPSIVMKSISLPQSAIMLLEGETVTYTVVVQNISSIPVDLLFLTFNDSTAFQLRSALANKELSPTELYELELASMRKQTFKWHRTTDDKDTNINPGMELPIQVEVLGKPGLTHGTTQIDYGYLGDSDRETAGSFYTRQLTIPITITVNASVELTRNDIVTFTSEFSWQNKRRKELKKTAEIPSKGSPNSSTLRSSPREQNGFQALLGRVGLNPHDSDHCLLTLDLRNSWPSLISISISISSPATKENSTSESWKRAYTVHESLQPGHTTRVLLLIPRIYLPNPYAPIPSLTPATKRQYVVSSTPKPNPEIELATREAFHYREALLELIRATWEEDTTHRSGAINLRALHLTTRMVSALKLDDVDIQLSIRNPEPTSPPSPAIITQLSHSTFNIPTSAFLTLTSTLTNRSPRPIHAILRLQPALQNQPHNIALDLSKKFLWSGLLQRVVGVLEPGATKVLELGFVVLCKGVFEIGGCVEEVGGRKEDAEEGGKRIWWARDGCVIVAEEREGIRGEDQKEEEQEEKEKDER